MAVTVSILSAKKVRKKHIFPIGVQAILGIASHKLENHFWIFEFVTYGIEAYRV